MLELDHLTIIAPTLEAGAAYVREAIGIEMRPGGKHPEMGTHNLLLRLGESVFLEVIAVDPDAAAPAGPRWFGLDQAETVLSAWENRRRLRGWVARSDALDATLALHGKMLGQKTRVSRGARDWWHKLCGSAYAHGGGFSVHAGVCIEAPDRAGLERLLRYCARPPLAMERLKQRGAALVYRGDCDGAIDASGGGGGNARHEQF